MAGIYFIAAGSSSRNRTKSLDQNLSAEDVTQHLEPLFKHQLNQHFVGDEKVFAWGAATKPRGLDELKQGDYVVDVNNRVVKHVFRYAFMIDTGEDLRLQDWIGWDAEVPVNERRSFKYVYFLRAPQATRRDKSFFEKAFGQEGNQNWLAGQRWFSDDEVRAALERTGTRSVEDLLGLEPGASPAAV